MKAAEFKQLYRKRGIILTRFDSFSDYIDSIKNISINDFDNDNISELELNIHRAEGIMREFDEVQMSIEMNCHDDTIAEEQVFRKEHDLKFCKNLSIANSTLKQLHIRQKNKITSSGTDKDESIKNNFSGLEGVKLPPIKLPSFNADYLKWIEFKDTFESLIHNNKTLTDIQKYHYLRSSLTDDASKIIQSLEFSAQNYVHAWQTLCNRFDNSRMLVNNHMKALFEINSLAKENANGLRNLIDTVKKHLSSLKTLKLPTESWDAIIIHLISGKLDKTTALEWEKSKNDSDSKLSTIDEFYDFLRNRANFLETVELNLSSNNKVNNFKHDYKDKKYSKSLFVNHAITKSCNLCKKDHMIYICEKFLNYPVSERWNQVKRLKLCCNCLCTGHIGKQCRKSGCKLCNKKHSSLLHDNKQVTNSETNSDSHDSEKRLVDSNSLISNVSHVKGDVQNDNLTLLNEGGCNDFVILSTAKIKVYDKWGKPHLARIMLDSGSQCCFVSERLCETLGLEIKNTEVSSVSGVNNLSSSINKQCKIKIGSRINEFSSILKCFVVQRVTKPYPSYSFDISQWNIPANVILADDSLNTTNQIDILSDASLFWDILLEGNINCGKNLPSLQNTVFGYIATGKIIHNTKNFHCNLSVQYLKNENDELQKFWSIEEPKHTAALSENDLFCEEYFTKTTTRAKNGQFIVKVPWKDCCDLGESKSTAIKRLLNLESRFKRNPDFKRTYFEFIDEYKKLGHMSVNNGLTNENYSYFLPHHGVVRNDHLTTKLRVVFDGSAPSSNGNSLNDIQFSGPAIQNDILNILLRFRQHPVVVISDISKMYRMVLVHPDDRPMQQLLWRNDASQAISSYTLNTVTYGTASAPFLAMRCVQQLAYDNEDIYPEACKIILRDFYVDDLITGFSCKDTAIKICEQIDTILKSASFNLRKWSSNSKDVLSNFKISTDSLSVLNLGDNESIKTLGVQWSCKLDTFTFHVQQSTYTNVTKRSMLSSIAKIYDPLGLLSCSIILVKMMIQTLWSLKLSWDSEVPPELASKWRQFQENVIFFNKLKIPRFVLSTYAATIELHGFSDASNNAYCAAIYVRCINSDGKIDVNLLCAKTKVAPVKILTIPRLELCGSVLLITLMTTVKQSITFPFKVFYWCDSQIVLHWIHTNPANLQVFVGNRIAEIQRNSSSDDWYYVNTSKNPADIGSRGIMPNQLNENHIWFKGPRFLSTEFEIVRFSDLPSPSEYLEFKKDVKVLNVVENHFYSIFHKFSSLNKLIRVFAYCLRFLANLKKLSKDRVTGPILITEFNDSKFMLIKLAQKESFSSEISLLKGKRSLPSNSRLLSLTPFMDENDLLRVGGRLKYSSLRFGEKHPILLDKKHNLSKLILEHEHKQLQHAGPQLLLAHVRQNFWIISGMSLAKLIVRKCIRCFKFKPKPSSSIMADLPKHRVTISQPFSITGLDYIGPFLLKDRKGRGCKTYKAYVCLFICFSTKAVHLELISTLTSEAFLAGLRRFTSRRGKPAHIYSDNGSNLVGAQRELKSLYDCLRNSEHEIVSSLAGQNICWHFIPPSTPNFGGLWESNVKGVKFHLYRVIGNTLLTYEEFFTFLVQVEATLNSRPLYALSSDPNDYLPLTPSHFLICRSMTTIPDPLFEDIRVNQLSRYQLIQQILQGFWKQWSRLYLNQLQQRKKWKTSCSPLTIGTLVLLKDDNLPPCNWNMGRIVATHPGNDGVVRVVTVKTARGIYKRGVSKCCPLPLAETAF